MQGTLGTDQVDSELELIHKLILATANCTTISSDEATRVHALEALEEKRRCVTDSYSQ